MSIGPYNTAIPAERDAMIMAIEVRLSSGETFASADDYYWHKDTLRSLYAKRANTTAAKIDPVGFWYGGQS